MITAGDFRKGVTFEYEGNIYTIVEFQHVKPGKGAAFVRTKMKNVVTGAVLEKTWNPTEKVQEAHIETKFMTYSYNDGELYYFMDDEFNLTPLNYEQVEDALHAYRIGEAIKAERLRQNLTQEELGERIGVQKAQISRMERGYSISIPTMSRVFKALGISTATLDLGIAGKVALW